MAFSFDELTKKAKDMANLAADKAKDAAELTKISVAIAGEQKEIDKNYRTIGEWFVNEYEGEIPDAVREMVEAVAASKAKIAELEASKPTKEEPAAAEAPAAGGHGEWPEALQRVLRGAKQRKAPRGSSKAAAMASTMAKAAFRAVAPLEQANAASPVTR